MASQILSVKEEEVLKAALKYFPYYGDFSIRDSFNKIPVHKLRAIEASDANRLELFSAVGQYLIDYGFAEKKSDDFGAGIYVELTRKGRWLREKASLKSYQEYKKNKRTKITADNLQAVQRATRDKYTYRIQLCIAISTGIAAVYYLLEVLNHYWCIYRR